jgi:hypothetical protein
LSQVINIITILGISLAVFGAIILYKYGPPAMPIIDGMQIFCVPPATEEEREKNRKEERLRLKRAKQGLGLSVIGCLVQIVALLVALAPSIWV